VVQPRHDLTAAPLDGPLHRGVAAAGERRRILVEREDSRTGLVHELRQHLLGVACAHEQGRAPLLQVATQAAEAIEKEASSRLPHPRAGEDPRIQHEDRQPLLHGRRERLERRVVLEAQIVAEPVKTARHPASILTSPPRDAPR
jgi:hypothetical protein